MQKESTNSPMVISPSAQIKTSMADIFTPPPYSSIYFHNAACPSTYTTSSLTPKEKSTVNAAAAKSLSHMMIEHKDLLNRYAFCLNQLRKLFKEAETLRQENTNLRLANVDLSNQVNLLIQATLQNAYQTQPFSDSPEQYRSSASSLSSVGGSFEKERESGNWNEGFSKKVQSPKAVAEKTQEECNRDENDTARVTLPKSISVRSNGFQKSSAGVTGSTSAPLRSATRIRAPSPVAGPQKVYVRGGSQKDGPIELDVYNQGMFKTELCNKWQETGSCPYGDHCQFAHGISELRPVIRHPRYKTEVCRMVLSGDPCPYGHRCHFRHALTDEEKLMLPLRLD